MSKKMIPAPVTNPQSTLEGTPTQPWLAYYAALQATLINIQSQINTVITGMNSLLFPAWVAGSYDACHIVSVTIGTVVTIYVSNEDGNITDPKTNSSPVPMAKPWTSYSDFEKLVYYQLKNDITGP